LRYNFEWDPEKERKSRKKHGVAFEQAATVFRDPRMKSLYDDDPFGRTIESSGTYKNTNKFRFSTKYFEDDWGLSYYGYRYYQADTGRWLNRDPIGESMGIGLYVFAVNCPISRVDAWGLQSQESSEGQGKSGFKCCEATKVVIKKAGPFEATAKMFLAPISVTLEGSNLMDARDRRCVVAPAVGARSGD
jgi:RHS repeat-associated protein